MLIMEKKEIQEQRMRGYFIQATKEMLKGEGLKSVSVRSIADRAGYSFATMYHYFKDINELVFLCVQDFQNECEAFVKSDTANNGEGTEKIKAISKAYIKYFVQYPGIFELFYLERISDIDKKKPTSELICTFLDRLCADEWNKCIQQKIIRPEQAQLIRNEVKYMVTGLLLLYMNRRHPSAFSEFVKTADSQLNFIFSNIGNK